MELYLLDKNKNPVPFDFNDRLKYEYEFRHDFVVRKTILKKYDVEVSTVFFGMDVSCIKRRFEMIPFNSPPLFFETMIFWPNNPKLDEFKSLYTTWNESLQGHRDMVRLVIAEIRKITSIGNLFMPIK